MSFFQTSIPIEKIDLLKTAGEALEPEHFKELIQRDIDDKRVKEIVDEYLESKNIVLFFPPLIVSVIAHDNNKTVPVYEKPTHTLAENGKAIISEWGERFRVSVPTDNKDTGYLYQGQNSKPFWTNFEIKKNKVHLVVIDGQHRLCALKKLKDRDPEACARMDIPICIVYSPDAVDGNPNSETITTDVRELFVRINNTGKQVSGHFITLLEDGSITAIAVREICEYAKTVELKYGATLLNLIEWNVRENRRASQLNKRYSLTSVGILSQVLKTYGFSKKKGSPTALLKLKSKENELYEREPYLNIDEINSDSTIPASQYLVLESLAKEEVAPALVILFTEPRPYKLIIEAFEIALKSLDKDISEDKLGAKIYKQVLLKEFRETNDFDPINVKNAGRLFSDEINDFLDEKLGKNFPSIYQLSVFQQGYIRAWIKLCQKLNGHGVTNKTVAEFLVAAATSSIFDSATDIFGLKNYTDLTLYKNQKPQQSVSGKDSWSHLILASLLNPISQNTMKSYLKSHFNDEDKANQIMSLLNEQVFEDSLEKFSAVRKQAQREYYLENWKNMEETIDAETFQNLLDLGAVNNDDSSAEQESVLESLSDKKFHDIRRKLRSAIGIE